MGNVEGKWQCFKQQFELYMAAIGLDSKPDTRRMMLLLTVAGPQAIKVLNMFEFAPPEDQGKYDKVLKKFQVPQKNTVQRCNNLKRLLISVTDLKLKAQLYGFGDLDNSMIRDQVVYGICEKWTRERL